MLKFTYSYNNNCPVHTRSPEVRYLTVVFSPKLFFLMQDYRAFGLLLPVTWTDFDPHRVMPKSELI